MALTIVQYVEEMRERQHALAMQLGADLSWAPQELRVVLTCANAMTAIVFQALSELGLVTDEQLAARFDAAMAEAFGQLPPPGEQALDLAPDLGDHAGHEALAGELIPDPWDHPLAVGGAIREPLALTGIPEGCELIVPAGGDDDGGLDPGAVSAQSQG